MLSACGKKKTIHPCRHEPIDQPVSLLSLFLCRSLTRSSFLHMCGPCSSSKLYNFIFYRSLFILLSLSPTCQQNHTYIHCIFNYILCHIISFHWQYIVESINIQMSWVLYVISLHLFDQHTVCFTIFLNVFTFQTLISQQEGLYEYNKYCITFCSFFTKKGNRYIITLKYLSIQLTSTVYGSIYKVFTCK